jgi:hypothetical protein
MDEDLTLIEWTENRGLWIAQPDHAEELVINRVGHRDRVRKLLRGVNAVVVADRDIRGG